MFGFTDYWITHVTYTRASGKTLLKDALVHANVGSSHEFGEKWTREEILSKADFLLFAVLKTKDKGAVVLRADVRVVNVKGESYLRIDDKIIDEDYLGNFPETDHGSPT